MNNNSQDYIIERINNLELEIHELNRMINDIYRIVEEKEKKSEMDTSINDGYIWR